MTVDELLAGVVIPIDKPRQWTSFQAVNKVKATVRSVFGLKKFKIGHAGTLDPLATGLLIVCIGKATKDIAAIQDGEKEYTGTMVIGATTPCYDLEQAVDREYPYRHVDRRLVEQVRRQFEGEVMQVPPMFSAVKIDGQRAYEYARRDDPMVTIQPKPVKIHSFEITGFRESEENKEFKDIRDNKDIKDVPEPSIGHHLYDRPLGRVPEHLPQVDFRVRCGKGTYIRSLARDFGEALGSGAFLSALRRTRVGEYSIEQALQLDEVGEFLRG